MSEQILKILDRCSDHLSELIRYITLRNPAGLSYGALLGALLSGVWELLLNEPNLWLCMPLGILIVNSRGLLHLIQGKPFYDERVLLAIQIIKDYEAAGGPRADVRRLYFELAKQIVRQAGIELELDRHVGTEELRRIDTESDPSMPA